MSVLNSPKKQPRRLDGKPFGPRMVCTGCEIIGAFARPNWQEPP